MAYAVGRPEAALILVLVAVGATSRRRRPVGTPSVRHPGSKMGDGEAFETFFWEEMPRISRLQNYNVAYRGKMHRMERVLYKWFRCELFHAARLPATCALSRTRDAASPKSSTTWITFASG